MIQNKNSILEVLKPHKFRKPLTYNYVYKITVAISIILFFILSSCDKTSTHKQALFQKINPKQTGVTFQNINTPTEKLNILDYLYFYNGGGVAVGDINNDELPDIFFTANQGDNKLYLNKGDFRFEDITNTAGIAGTADWNTGTSMVDINGDGYLDIYVCAVVGLHGLKGKNELYINNKNNTFTEMAADYGLDFKNYSTAAAFFDYDLDGDLDMYLLNHATHTQHSFGSATLRNKRHEESGDKLLRNEGGRFIDVSETAGIYGGGNGYGLGVATADFNNDGFTDLYISNDFHEDDYYYLNNGNGTFREELKQKFGHTSRFSMGSDVADINHDGYPDILTLDMMPEDEKILKASDGDETMDMLKMRIKKLGYHYQFARNMLQINQKGKFFSETALLSGISATDWSWSALFADYDQDGEQDIFISNGIPKRPNDLDFIKYISNEKIQKKLNSSKLMDTKALDEMPSGTVQNYMFKGAKNLYFENKSEEWLPLEVTAATGSAYADFDNDGDLDLVINNSNAPASLYKNTIDSTSHFLKLNFRFKNKNKFGIGTKVISYHQGIAQYKQLFTSKGFQSSSEPLIHFGYGPVKMIDSLKVIWPDNTVQVAENIATNQSLTIQPLHQRDAVKYEEIFPQEKNWFKKTDSLPGLQFLHHENNYNDANRQKLIPYQISDKGPATAVGDINNDGKEDIFFGSSRNQISKLFLQTAKGFKEYKKELFEPYKKQEDVYAIIDDLNGDAKNDLLIATAGGEFYGNSSQLTDRLYLTSATGLEKAEFPELFENKSIIKPYDIDQDGDLDLFIGGYAVANDFGKIPNSSLLLYTNGKFEKQENKQLQKVGMVTDAIWSDFDKDGLKDLIVIGAWMAPTFFKNDHGHLVDVTEKLISEKLHGLWQSITAFDIDQDGDEDYLIGNFGLNSKFKASTEFPLKMYYSDVDQNKKTETVLALAKNGKYYTLSGLDELSAQLNYLKKKFTTYKDFAGKTVEEVIGKKELDKAKQFLVHELASGYLKNNNGTFSFVPFTNELQTAPITKMLKYDFNNDGKDEVLLAGNYFGITPYHGRFDGFGGALIQDEDTVLLSSELGLNLSQKPVIGLNMLTFATTRYLIITINNDKAEIYEFPENTGK